MNLIILSGFLGSGKTSLLLAIAREFAKRTNGKLAIIENESGAVGVDNIYLADQGLQVRELYAGCVCCSLRIDLVTTLTELAKTYAPDLVIVEASGVAAPSIVRDAFAGYSGRIDSIQTLVVFDLVRMQNLKIMSMPFVNGCIRAADLVLLNKADRVEASAIAATVAFVADVRPHLACQPVSTLTGQNIDMLCDRIFGFDSFVTPVRDTLVPPPAHDHHLPSEKIGDPVAASLDAFLTIAPDADLGKIGECAADLVAGIARDLVVQGCSMVGHVKAIIAHDGRGTCLVSTVAADEVPSVRNSLALPLVNPKIVINAILYGLSKECAQNILTRNIGRCTAFAVR